MKKLLLSSLMLLLAGTAAAQQGEPVSLEFENLEIPTPIVQLNLAEDIQLEVSSQLKTQAVKYQNTALFAYQKKQPVKVVRKARQSE
ncbi:hypothetical protein IT774_10455 [Salinimonas marina]|uniref:Uncharacterized protein n=1 Tax=Salinimonas marina TaxID=2785918 RepID=A0A7S9HCN3_9ALTE|nr:hypothetical protein [Salinimonas marina]QPG04651.1 hypothetical protein IT774_10455 [Salinimonas marina]